MLTKPCLLAAAVVLGSTLTACGTDSADGGGLPVVPASAGHLHGIAVNPADGSKVLATTQDGPVASTDGGKTFTYLDGAPLIVFLAWAAPDALWAVDSKGGVHHSADGGASWHPRGNAGAAPEALAAKDESTVFVALEDQIMRSVDGGETFQQVADRE